MAAQKRYPDELRERAVKMVLEIREQDGKGHARLTTARAILASGPAGRRPGSFLPAAARRRASRWTGKERPGAAVPQPGGCHETPARRLPGGWSQARCASRWSLCCRLRTLHPRVPSTSSADRPPASAVRGHASPRVPGSSVRAARQKRAALTCPALPRIYGSRLNGMESLCPDGRSVRPFWS